MTDRPSYPFAVTSRDVWRIALPASLAFITEPLVGFTDITVIGRLGDADLLGGLVLGALVFDFIFSLAYFLRIGTAGLTAQAVGARDPRDGLLHASRAIVLAVIIGAAMIVLSVPLFWLALRRCSRRRRSPRRARDVFLRPDLGRAVRPHQLRDARLVLWPRRGDHRHDAADC